MVWKKSELKFIPGEGIIYGGLLYCKDAQSHSFQRYYNRMSLNVIILIFWEIGKREERTTTLRIGDWILIFVYFAIKGAGANYEAVYCSSMMTKMWKILLFLFQIIYEHIALLRCFIEFFINRTLVWYFRQLSENMILYQYSTNECSPAGFNSCIWKKTRTNSERKNNKTHTIKT